MKNPLAIKTIEITENDELYTLIATNTYEAGRRNKKPENIIQLKGQKTNIRMHLISMRKKIKTLNKL